MRGPNSRSRAYAGRCTRSVLVAAALAAGCARNPEPVAGPVMQPAPTRPISAVDASTTDLYQRAGFLVSSEGVPFVASIRYLGGPSVDSTYAIVALSFANEALTFSREGGGERFRAGYDVTIAVRRGDSVLVHVPSRQDVRVASFAETTRHDESVVFQEKFLVRPGAATLSIEVADAGSTKRGRTEAAVTIPSFAEESVGWPIVAYAATARARRAAVPEVVMNPRSTVVVGRDSVAEVYVESYGSSYSAITLRLVVNDVAGREILRDVVPLADRGGLLTGDARLPLARLLPGLSTIVVSSPDETGTVRVPLIVSFGEGLAVSTYEAMLDYLRWFSTPERVRALRDAPVELRATEWAEFLRQTDATPITPENEALRDYLARLETANVRFREGEAQGWSTDRGMVFAVLGEPDNVMATGGDGGSARARTQTWEYSAHRVHLTFVEEPAPDRWRLTPESDADFRALQRRLRP